MSDPPDNTPQYISDNWYLKDMISKEDLKSRKIDEPQTPRNFVNYIQNNGNDEDREALLTIETEFTQKVLDLVQTIRNRKDIE